MKELKLVLTHQWYDMIDTPMKGEEYRRVSAYWIKRLFVEDKLVNSDGDMEPYRLTDKQCEEYEAHPLKLAADLDAGLIRCPYTHVTFQRAYHKNPPRMTWSIRGIRIGTGEAEWGAYPRTIYIVIMLGERKEPAK